MLELLKMLDEKWFKGIVKQVRSLEEARIVLINNKVVTKDKYIKMVKKGRDFTSDDVYYLTL